MVVYRNLIVAFGFRRIPLVTKEDFLFFLLGRGYMLSKTWSSINYRFYVDVISMIIKSDDRKSMDWRTVRVDDRAISRDRDFPRATLFFSALVFMHESCLKHQLFVAVVVVGHIRVTIVAGPEFKVTSLAARTGEAVNGVRGRASNEGMRMTGRGEGATRVGKRGNEKGFERGRVTGKGWVVREGKAKP